MRHRALLLALALLASLFAVPAQTALAEPAECGDAIDNDNDGAADYPEDGDCNSAQDDSEATTSQPAPAYLTIRYDRGTRRFLGYLTDHVERGCRSNRLVRVKKVVSGPNKVIGSDRTDGNYDWVIPKENARGRFYAVGPEVTKLRRDGTTVTCDRLRSVTIRIG